jgi:hypothetical protein
MGLWLYGRFLADYGLVLLVALWFALWPLSLLEHHRVTQ